jgi:hypothetical protein
MILSQLLSLRQDIEKAFSPTNEKNEVEYRKEGRPDFADVFDLGRSPVKGRKRDAFLCLAPFFQVSSTPSPTGQATLGAKTVVDGQNWPTASHCGNSIM